MTKIVNLRTRRKQRKRADERTDAAASALVHGETRPARALRDAQAELAARRLDGHRREPQD